MNKRLVPGVFASFAEAPSTRNSVDLCLFVPCFPAFLSPSDISKSKQRTQGNKGRKGISPVTLFIKP